MAERAQVTSVEAIEAFRANLIIYVGRARSCLEEVSSDMQRAKQWLQSDQRRLWENERRVRGKKLEQARNELFSAKLSNLQEASSVQFLAAQRAERAVREAEEKLTMLKKWDRELENRSEPLLKQADQLHTFLTTDMPRAVAHLSQIVKTLDAYAGVALPGGAMSDVPKTTEPPAGEGESS
jgi:hypothetical protein